SDLEAVVVGFQGCRAGLHQRLEQRLEVLYELHKGSGVLEPGLGDREGTTACSTDSLRRSAKLVEGEGRRGVKRVQSSTTRLIDGAAQLVAEPCRGRHQGAWKCAASTDTHTL